MPLLLLLSAAKFALVAMFYMHLKQDHRLFTGVFVFPLIIATVIILALIVLDGLPLRLRQLGVTLLPFVPLARRAAATYHPVRAELGAASQRSPRHRASRCLVLLRDRAAGAGARGPAAGAALAGRVVRAARCWCCWARSTGRCTT